MPEISNNSDTVSETIPEFKYIDTTDGLKLMMGDTALYLSVLRTFATEYQDRTNQLRQLLHDDRESAKRITHTMKGLSANIGAKALHDVAATLDATLNDSLLPIFEIELMNVIDEIKNSALFDEQQAPQQKKAMISKEKRDELFKDLVNAIKKRRPPLIQPVIASLEFYELSSSDTEMIETIKPFIKKYKFKQALETIDEVFS